MGFQLVKGRLTCTPVVIEKPVVEKTKVEPPVEVKPQGKIDINTAGGKEISDFLGCPTYHAYAITSYRKNNGNFVCLEELNDIKKIPKDFLEKYGEFLTIGEEEPEVTEVTEVEESGMTLDINTASTRDFMDVGFGKREAALIVSERKKFGNFKNVEDLSEIPGVTGKILRKLKDVLYVESSGVKPYYVG
jgi:competence ComEA-like helix-hairpin-helix protein